MLALQELGEKFDASTFDWTGVKDHGLHNRCIRGQLEKKISCGRILEHAKDLITSFREQIGVRLCCFKIGITSNPLIRFISYIKKGYTHMWLISVSHSIDLVQMLEAALVSEFSKHVGCQNQSGSGGEGALNRENPPFPPYFVYITGARADQNRRVGWHDQGWVGKKTCLQQPACISKQHQAPPNTVKYQQMTSYEQVVRALFFLAILFLYQLTALQIA